MRWKLLGLGVTMTLGLTLPAAPVAAESPQSEAAPAGRTTLGPVVVDDQGREGRIHEVVVGDTLWDISDAYLGTPWVWPSLWGDNADIENPHLIHPGDKLWVSAGEIRRVSDEEAARLLASGGVPAALADGMEAPRPTFRVAEIETVGFVTQAQLEGAATLVDSHVDRVWLGDHDPVIVGLGEGEAQVGERWEIFRTGARVKDPETRKQVGWQTMVLGWLEITEIHGETATGIVRLSRGEIRRGDRLLPKPPVQSEIAIADKPDVEGVVVFTPDDRFDMGSADVVYLNRGAGHGIEVGSPLEVYRDIGTERDAVKKRYLELPDRVIGKLLVVATTPDSATAVVTHATMEINPGDRFRGSESISW